MEEMLVSIANYGFPAVLSIYLLIRMETKLDQLSCTILKLDKTILISSKERNKYNDEE